jgi:hypothetical protein
MCAIILYILHGSLLTAVTVLNLENCYSRYVKPVTYVTYVTHVTMKILKYEIMNHCVICAVPYVRLCVCVCVCVCVLWRQQIK